MKQGIRFIAVAALLMVLGACNSIPLSGNVVTGSGNVKTEKRDVSGFSAVSFTNVGTLTITVTGTESLVIEAEDNILPVLTSEVSGNRLTLGTRNDTNVKNTKPINYTLTVKSLDDVQLSGSGDIVANDVAADKFSSQITGSGNVTIHGKADGLNVKLSGSGNFNGQDFESTAATATVTGSGNIAVNASNTLDATISGSGNIRYIGSPTIKQSITGSGTIGKE